MRDRPEAPAHSGAGMQGSQRPMSVRYRPSPWAESPAQHRQETHVYDSPTDAGELAAHGYRPGRRRTLSAWAVLAIGLATGFAATSPAAGTQAAAPPGFVLAGLTWRSAVVVALFRQLLAGPRPGRICLASAVAPADHGRLPRREPAVPAVRHPRSTGPASRSSPSPWWRRPPRRAAGRVRPTARCDRAVPVSSPPWQQWCGCGFEAAGSSSALNRARPALKK